MVCLLAADLLTHMPRQNTVAKASVYAQGISREGAIDEKRPGEMRAFQTKGAHDRFYFEMRPDPTADYMGRRLGLYGNCNLIDQIHTVDGFYSLYLSWERDVWQRLFFAPTNAFPTGLARFLGIRAMSFAENPVEWIKPELEAMPMLTAGQRVEVLDQKQILERISDPSFDPSKVVYVSDPSFPKTSATKANIEIFASQAHAEWAVIDCDEPTVAVISKTYHPAWRAKVGRDTVKPVRVNGAYMAVPLRVGRNNLHMYYRDHSFVIGSIISLGALGLTMGMWAWGQRGRDRSV